jgi:hypothetical protein
MSDQLMPWHQTWMTNLDYDRVDLVKEGANSQAHIKIIKQKGGITMDLDQILAKLEPNHRSVIEKALKDKDEATTAEIAKTKKAEEDLAVARTEVEKLKAEAPLPAGQTEEDIIKSIKDPSVRALMEMQIAKTKVAEEAVAKAQDAALETEAVAKAKDVVGLGAEEALLATVYKKLKKVDAQLCTDVFGIFKAASELAKEGTAAFQETGITGNQNASAGVNKSFLANGKSSAQIWEEIQTIAKGIKGDNKSMPLHTAVSKAMEDHPELYAQYIDAQNRGN